MKKFMKISTRNILIIASVFVIVFCLLQFNGQLYGVGDSVPYRYLPMAILEHKTFRLDAFPQLANPKYYAVVRDKDGCLISKKPVSPALFEIPFYLLMTKIKGGKLTNIMELIYVGKLTMVFCLAMTCALLTAVLLHFSNKWLAFIGGIGLAFATPIWFTAMDCWPHPLLAMLKIACLFLILRRNENWVWFIIGFLQATAITVRLGAIAVAVVFLIASFWSNAESFRKRSVRLFMFLLGTVLPLFLLGFYNYHYFGDPFTSGFKGQAADRIILPFEPIMGYLVSPAKGILLYAPILLLMLFCRGRACSCPNIRAGMRAGASPAPTIFDDLKILINLSIAAFTMNLLFWSFYADWWGGWSFGPRYLTEAMPFAIFLTVIGFQNLLSSTKYKKAVIIISIILLIFSFAVQMIGMFSWNGDYHMQFDKGWSEGSDWVWTAPYEPIWRAKNLFN